MQRFLLRIIEPLLKNLNIIRVKNVKKLIKLDYIWGFFLIVRVQYYSCLLTLKIFSQSELHMGRVVSGLMVCTRGSLDDVFYQCDEVGR